MRVRECLLYSRRIGLKALVEAEHEEESPGGGKGVVIGLVKLIQLPVTVGGRTTNVLSRRVDY